jgi:hypothetical protein
MPHETSTGSSPIVKGLMNNLREILPGEERTKLEGYAQQAEATKPHGDLHRARYCLRWAIEMAERPEHSHLAHLAIRMKETHKEWQDIWLGLWFGSEVEIGHGQASREIPKGQEVGPGEEVRLGRRSVGGAPPKGHRDQISGAAPSPHRRPTSANGVLIGRATPCRSWRRDRRSLRRRR